MQFILDTNICIYIIKKKPEQVLKRLSKIDPSTIAISSITWAELMYGAAKSKNRERNLDALKDFIIPFEILPWTVNEASVAGEVRAALEKLGTPIGPFDTQIAAHALFLDLILVTNNEQEFNRIPGLKIDNWTK
jgi:tRNA(fMet)-specific endonuclease VapC